VPPRPIYIDAADDPLFGVFHAPAAARAGEGRPAVLFCAPWGWNETVSYRSRRDWAEALAAAGHPVLTFDLPGVGDSGGSPRDHGLVERWVGAVIAAGEHLASLAPGREVAALGMELGGLLALGAARRGAPIEALAMWAVPRDGRGFFRATKAFSRMQRWGGGPDGDSPLPEGWIEAAGFVISAETAAELQGLKPTEGSAPAGVRRALVLGREQVAADQPLVDHLAGAGIAVEAGPGPGWEDMVTHPGYTTAPPETMERFGSWLTAGLESGDAAPVVDAPPVVEPGGAETLIAVGDGTVRERPLDVMPAGTFGILAEPVDTPTADHCVIFLNAGAVRHIGPDRIWVDSARELAAAGIRSVRVDLAGIGEAEGESARFAEVAEFYEPEFGEQVAAVMGALEGAGIGRRFILAGLCSGGYWAYRLGVEDERVDRVVLLNTGAFVWRHSLVMEYDEKGISMLGQGRLWRKLLHGEFDLKKIRAFAHLVLRRLRQEGRSLYQRVRGGGDGPSEREPRLEAELDLLRDRGTAMALAFSAAEPAFEEIDRKGIVAEIGRWPNVDLIELPGVDHALASTSAQAAARDLLRRVAVGDVENVSQAR
jgi:alpha-beta hydrolase superfamily lysophospholipase